VQRGRVTLALVAVAAAECAALLLACVLVLKSFSCRNLRLQRA